MLHSPYIDVAFMGVYPLKANDAFPQFWLKFEVIMPHWQWWFYEFPIIGSASKLACISFAMDLGLGRVPFKSEKIIQYVIICFDLVHHHKHG